MKTIDVLSQIRYWALALAVCFCLPALSQELTHRPFLEEGKVWTLKYLVLEDGKFPPKEKLSKFFVKGDTIVDGLKCKKICQDKDWFYDIYYEEDSKVYLYIEGKKELLFDFGCSVGDTTFYVGITEMKVVSIDTVQLRNNYCRQIGIGYYDEPEDPNWPLFAADYWIEGIGSVYSGPLIPLYTFGSYPTELISVTVNGEEIYNKDDFKPSAIKEVGDPSVRRASSAIYNLRGQRLSTAPQHGVYIQDGKMMAR